MGYNVIIYINIYLYRTNIRSSNEIVRATEGPDAIMPIMRHWVQIVTPTK